jgi:hypothetical protein
MRKRIIKEIIKPDMVAHHEARSIVNLVSTWVIN